DQGPLGLRLGSAARQGSRRPARQADGRGRRRPVSEVRRGIGRLLPRTLLRRRPAAARDGQAHVRRRAEAAAARRARPREGLKRLQTGARKQGTAPPGPPRHDPRVRHGGGGGGEEKPPPPKEKEKKTTWRRT